MPGLSHLLRAECYRTWAYVAGSVTPNEMNDGNAAFPEFHNVYLYNVYMDPEIYRKFSKTGEFPDETVLFEKTLGIAGERAESGKGHFMGEIIGLIAGVKDRKRFANEPDHWAFFTFRETGGEKMKESA